MGVPTRWYAGGGARPEGGPVESLPTGLLLHKRVGLCKRLSTTYLRKMRDFVKLGNLCTRDKTRYLRISWIDFAYDIAWITEPKQLNC